MIIYAISAGALVFSALFLVVKICGFGLLVWQFVYVYKFQKPHVGLQSLTFKNKKWLIETQSLHSVAYEKVQVRIDTGFFQLIVFTSDLGLHKQLVLFRDQLPAALLRDWGMLTQMTP